MRTTVILWLLRGLVYLLPIAAAAQGDAVSGVVLDGSELRPLPAVRITAEAGEKQKTVVEATGPDGRFQIALGQLFSKEDRDIGVYVFFAHEGYRDYTRLIRSGEYATLASLEIRLEPTVTPPLGKDEEARIRRFRSADGRTIFLLPYRVPSEGAALNQTLAFQLRRGINTHLQSLDPSPADIGLEMLPAKIQGEGVSARAYGVQLNALAVVDGMVTKEVNEKSVAEQLQVSSEFEIIPSLPSFQPNTVWVDDSLDAASLQSTKLYELLNREWGRNATLAVSVLEAKHALEAGDRAALQKVRHYLIAERADLGPEAAPAAHQIGQLLALIEQALPQ
jgi:hypothetical protein